MLKWLIFYTFVLLADMFLYEVFVPSSILLHTVFVAVFIFNFSGDSIARVVCLTVVSILYGALFQHNLGLLLLVVVVTLGLYELLDKVVRRPLVPEILFSLLLLQVLVVGYLIEGERPSPSWIMAFVLINTSLVFVFDVAFTRVGKSDATYLK